jgi:hypothetical protein
MRYPSFALVLIAFTGHDVSTGKVSGPAGRAGGRAAGKSKACSPLVLRCAALARRTGGRKRKRRRRGAWRRHGEGRACQLLMCPSPIGRALDGSPTLDFLESPRARTRWPGLKTSAVHAYCRPAERHGHARTSLVVWYSGGD